MDRYNEACDAEAAHPLVLLGAFVLDFLAIHPVLDGNGRLACLLTTHELLRQGYGIARYVSVEQRIFETKNSCYEALRGEPGTMADGRAATISLVLSRLKAEGLVDVDSTGQGAVWRRTAGTSPTSPVQQLPLN